ncbi:hypothetical protein [Pararhizobium antarcticum]|nr:hypothetical protein [Pararhizobium antarcticum]
MSTEVSTDLIIKLPATMTAATFTPHAAELSGFRKPRKEKQ